MTKRFGKSHTLGEWTAGVLSLASLRVLFDMVYLQYLVPVWGYMGYAIDFDPIRLVFSLGQLLLVVLLMPVRIDKPTDIAVVLMIALVILPFQTFAVWGGGSNLHLIAPFLTLLTIVAISHINEFRIPVVKQGRQVFIVFSVLATFSYLAVALAQGGLSNFNLDLRQVYDFRDIQKAQVQSGFFAYFANWVFKIILPTLAVYYFAKRKYFMTSGLLFLSLLFFGMSNHKTTLVFPLLSIGLFFLLSRRPTSFQVVLGFFALFSASIGLAVLLENHLMASFLVRRAIFVAPLNFMNYETYFSSQGFVFWANSIMSPFLNYAYDLSPGNIIGEFVGHGNNANSGFLASGYMHAGLFGILLYAVILALFLRFLDTFAKNGDAPVVSAVLAAPILHAYLNVDLLIALNTHGLLLLAILIYLAFGERRLPSAKTGHDSAPLRPRFGTDALSKST